MLIKLRAFRRRSSPRLPIRRFLGSSRSLEMKCVRLLRRVVVAVLTPLPTSRKDQESESTASPSSSWMKLMACQQEIEEELEL